MLHAAQPGGVGEHRFRLHRDMVAERDVAGVALVAKSVRRVELVTMLEAHPPHPMTGGEDEVG